MDELVKGNVRVSWEELGEGLDGDYDPNDPDDVELLRFDVSVFKDGYWEAVDDASYCTLMPISAPDILKSSGLRIIMDEVYEPLMAGYSIKKVCERLSWIGPDSDGNLVTYQNIYRLDNLGRVVERYTR